MCSQFFKMGSINIGRLKLSKKAILLVLIPSYYFWIFFQHGFWCVTLRLQFFLTVYTARPQKTKFHVPNLIFDPLLDENVGKYVLQFH